MEQVTISETEIVVVDVDTAITVVTGLMGPKGEDGTRTSLLTLIDVDTANITNGALLVYSTSTGKWHATNNLNNQTIEAGQY
jgi:hypothetical protein